MYVHGGMNAHVHTLVHFTTVQVSRFICHPPRLHRKVIAGHSRIGLWELHPLEIFPLLHLALLKVGRSISVPASAPGPNLFQGSSLSRQLSRPCRQWFFDTNKSAVMGTCGTDPRPCILCLEIWLSPSQSIPVGSEGEGLRMAHFCVSVDNFILCNHEFLMKWRPSSWWATNNSKTRKQSQGLRIQRVVDSRLDCNTEKVNLNVTQGQVCLCQLSSFTHPVNLSDTRVSIWNTYGHSFVSSCPSCKAWSVWMIVSQC